MHFRTLGRTGLEVSLLSLGSGGAKQLGQADDLTQREQTALVRRALDLGVNLIDTSRGYADSEAILGRALEGVQRDSYFMTTKWGPSVGDGVVDDPSLLVDSVEVSLRKLRTDRIDIMFFHGPMPDEVATVVERFYPTMERLKEQGKIRFVGISTRYASDAPQAAAEVALKTNPELWDVIMLKYGILNQHAAKEMLPLAIEHGVGIMNMASVRVKLPDPTLLQELMREWKKTGYIPQESLPDNDPLGWLVHGDVDSVISAAYKFAADHRAVSTVITGTASIAHLEANAAALESPSLPEDDTRRIEKLFGNIVEYA